MPLKPLFGLVLWAVLILALLVAGLALLLATPARADDEASNVANVVSGADGGRCYARSVPKHIYDPDDGPRQQGVTEIYRVAEPRDVLVETYDWFAQGLFVLCNAGGGEVAVVRLGPWARGHEPRADHLAVAFYRGGRELARYSTLAIAGPERTAIPGSSQFENVSVSVSHYTVFEGEPELVGAMENIGPVFFTRWFVRAVTVDGQRLTFEPLTGRLLPS